MAFVKVDIKEDKFINKGMNILKRDIGSEISECVNLAYRDILEKASDKSRDGVFTGTLYRKIKVNTYKSSSHGGKLAGRFINPKEYRLFISKPTKKQIQVLSWLEHGIDNGFYFKDPEKTQEWIAIKGKYIRNPKILKRKSGLPVGYTKNSAFVGGGKNPIVLSKTKIMLELERKLNITFRNK